MWWWRKVRRATIPAELRERFELYGETLMALAIESGDATRIGAELAGLGQQKRQEIVEWLRERRDLEECHEDRLETVEWAILIFVAIGVLADLAIVAHEIGWLRSS
jgi:hypothetical protein